MSRFADDMKAVPAEQPDVDWSTVVRARVGRRQQRRRVAGVAAALVLLGGTAVTVNSQREESTSLLERVTPTTEPSCAPTATQTLNGVELTVRLDRGDVRVGETVVADVTARNLGPKPIRLSSSCRVEVVQLEVIADPQQLAPVELAGRTFPVANGIGLPLPDNNFGSRPPGGCAARNASASVLPGETYAERQTWVAQSPNGAPYDGAARVLPLVSLQVPDIDTYPQYELSVPLRLSGGDPSRLTPQQALDAALADPAFRAAATAYASRGDQLVPDARLDVGRSDVGFTVSGPDINTSSDGASVVVTVDGATGVVGTPRTELLPKPSD